jgi:hypothetical protein
MEATKATPETTDNTANPLKHLNGASGLSPIEEVCQQSQAVTTEIAKEQQAHLQKVFAEHEQAKMNFQQAQEVLAQAQKNVAMTEGAINSFTNFLASVYGLTPLDSIDVQTGKINRKK